MKYIIIPIARVVVVLFVFLLLPIIIIAEGVLSLWHWDVKHIMDVYTTLTEEFSSEDKYVSVGETYYVYKNAWDYIRQKKTYKIKQ